MLLHTSSSLLRASGYFFPVCYWGATFEMQPSPAHWEDRDISAWLGPVGVQFPTLSWVHQSIIQPFFFFFVDGARGGGRGEISWTFPWFEIQKGRLGLLTTLTGAGAYLKTKLVSRVHSAGVRLTTHHFDQMWTTGEHQSWISVPHCYNPRSSP